MSIWKNGKLVAGGSQALPLLISIWSDHILDDISWLRADTFSWQSGAVYQAAYNELYDDIVDCVCWAGGGAGVYTKQRNPEVDDPVFSDYDLTQQVGVVSAYTNDSIVCNEVTYPFLDIYTVNGSSTETVAGISVRVCRGRSGRKCVLIRSSTKDPTAESDVAAIYNATGVAWYYIIDTVNERFKLPRAKHNKYQDTLSVAGNGTVIGITDGTNNATFVQTNKNYAPVHTQKSGYGEQVGQIAITTDDIVGAWKGLGITTDPEKSGMIAQQEQDTDQYKYLYFYVGAFTQTALENTAGINTELFNEKADTDLSNVNNTGKTAVVGWVMPDWQNAQNIDISVKNNPYTITENGYYVMVLNKDTANADAKILVNGIMVAVVAIGASWESTRVTLPLCVGDIVSSSGSVYSASISHYVPIKGLSA